MIAQKVKMIDAWDRGRLLWHGTACIALGISVVLALLEDEPPDVTPILFLSMALVLWYLWMSLRQGQQKENVHLTMGGMLIIEWLLWFVLTGYSPAFMLLLLVLIPQLFMTLPLSWAIVPGIFLNSLILIRFNEIDPEQTITWALITTAMLLSSLVMGYYIQTIIEQSRERKTLIVELEATRSDLAAAERDAGILQERQRLAQEIHDTMAQGFTSIVMHLEATENNPDNAAYHVREAKKMARKSLQDTRYAIYALRTEASSETTFEDKLRQLIAAGCLAHKIPAELVCTGRVLSLTAGVEHMILRIVQEALVNIRRHAAASEVNVTLTYLEEALMVDVQDDGVGFDVQTPRAGFGLAGMRERAASIQSELIIESTPQEGTTIALYVPVKEKAL